MSDETSVGPHWRQDVDLDQVGLALTELVPLLRAVAATGSSMLIKVDGERTSGANPPIFTVVISGSAREAAPIRYDDSDLPRGVAKAIGAFDSHRGA
jgi:hypothetical protein